MNQQILRRLLWKDARTLAPLAIAIAAGIAGLNFLLLALAHADVISLSNRGSSSYAFSILLPNLLAYGCGAMLIGAEEESGSLAWLRTLPASWRSIATSKLTIAATCILAAWAISGFGILSQRILADDFLPAVTRREAGYTEWVFLIVANIGFSLGLMLCGFLTSYLLRSPITALLAAVPLIIASTALFFWLSGMVITSGPGPIRPEDLPLANALMLGGVIVFILASLYLACQWAAKRRLSGPDRSADRVQKLDTAIEGFRPPAVAPMSWYSVSLIQHRPSRLAALLWQSARQNGWLLAILTLVGAASVTVAVAADRSQVGIYMFLPLLTTICLFAIASLTFYGDSVKQRCVFLSDRGISPALVWATRVLPSLLSVTIISLCFWVSASMSDRSGSYFEFPLLMIFGGFALCQLVSQWSPRPILAFFAGPPVMYAIAMMLLPLVFAYDHMPWFVIAAFWVSVPLFLFASYKLTPLWMQGPIDRRYTLRCLAYLAAFVVIPYVLVLGGRWATMPKLDTQWRAQAMAFQFPQRPEFQEPIENYLSDRGFHVNRSWQVSSRDFSDDEMLKLFEAEMVATDQIGQDLTLADVMKHMGYCRVGRTIMPRGTYPYLVPQDMPAEEVQPYLKDAYERDLRAMTLLLKWSTAIRNEARYGWTNLAHLSANAEGIEAKVASIIQEHMQEYGLKPEIAELIERFPDQAFVQESRINVLMIEWQRLREAEGFVRLFGTHLGGTHFSFFGFEREREIRLIEQDVKTGIDYLKTDFKKESEVGSVTRAFHPDRELGQLDYLFDEFSRRDRAVAMVRELAAKLTPEAKQ